MPHTEDEFRDSSTGFSSSICSCGVNETGLQSLLVWVLMTDWRNCPRKSPRKKKTTVVLSSVIPVVQSQRGGWKCALPGESITYRSIFPKSHLFLISPFHRILEKDHHIQKSYKLLKKPFRPLKHTRKYLFAYSRNTILIKAAYQRSQLLSKFSIKKRQKPRCSCNTTRTLEKRKEQNIHSLPFQVYHLCKVTSGLKEYGIEQRAWRQRLGRAFCALPSEEQLSSAMIYWCSLLMLSLQRTVCHQWRQSRLKSCDSQIKQGGEVSDLHTEIIKTSDLLPLVRKHELLG